MAWSSNKTCSMSHVVIGTEQKFRKKKTGILFKKFSGFTKSSKYMFGVEIFRTRRGLGKKSLNNQRSVPEPELQQKIEIVVPKDEYFNFYAHMRQTRKISPINCPSVACSSDHWSRNVGWNFQNGKKKIHMQRIISRRLYIKVSIIDVRVKM